MRGNRRFASFACGVSLTALLVATNAVGALPLEGHLVGVAWERAYLDRGTRDGIAAGARILIERGTGEPLAATVEVASERHTSVVIPVGASLHAGDRWSTADATPIAALPDTVGVRPAPRSPDPAALEAGWRDALAAGFTLRTTEAHPPAPGVSRIVARSSALAHRSGATKTYGGGELSVRSTLHPTGSANVALRLDGDLADWAARPSDDRLRPATDPFLLVRRASLDFADREGLTQGSIGRFREPHGGAGTSLIDGARISVTTRGRRTVELGGYGGVTPDPFTLKTSQKRGVFGGFLDFDAPAGSGGSIGLGLRLERRQTGGSSRTEGTAIFTDDQVGKFKLRGEATYAFIPNRSGLTEARFEAGGRVASVDLWARHRLSRPLRSTGLVTRAGASAEPPELRDPSMRSEIGIVRDPGRGPRLRAQVSRTEYQAGRDRWAFDSELSGLWRFGPIRSWRLGYRGSVGWQEGHEGELGATLRTGAWKMDLYGGGGALNQDLAKRITFIGRGGISLGRGLGRSGELSLTGSAYVARYAAGGTAALRLSWRF